VAPSRVSWGLKALPRYLGDDRQAWRAHDACALLDDGARFPGTILVDQGEGDRFPDEQSPPGRLERACAGAGPPAARRRRPGPDPSDWFVQSLIGDHLRHRAAALGG